MRKLAQIANGASKWVYETDDPEKVIISFKDSIVSNDGLKRCSVHDRGSVNNQITNILMRVLERNGVPTQYIEEINDTDTIVRRVEPIELTLLVRDYAAGTLAKRLGLPEGTPMRRTVIDFRSRNHALGDPMVNSYHIAAMNWATEAEMRTIVSLALRVNQVLGAWLRERNITLIDTKLEFGRLKDGTIILCDELGPDACRLWDSDTHERLDKDRFREDDPDGLHDAYLEILNRLKGA